MSVRSGSEIIRRNKVTRGQREIFLIEQTRPDTNCNIWFYKVIRGALDLEVLENGIKHLIARVPLLQTRFIYSDGELWQIHDQSIHHDLKTIILTSYSNPMEEAFRRMREARNLSGRMTDGKLFEFTVYIIDNNEYILYARFNHGIIDVRSWAKFEYLLAAAYNDLKQCKGITMQLDLHFDALSYAEGIYQASDEYEKDRNFWQVYVQPMEHLAYTQRSINSVGKKITYRQTMTLNTSEYQKLQQVAVQLNISESFLYIGVSALLLRNLLDHEYVSLSLPVRGTFLTEELGMTSNALPLLLHIPKNITIREVFTLVTQETKSILKHQRYRIDEILKLANYSSNFTFGPYVNIMRFDHGEPLIDCISSSHFGGNIDINDLQIIFWPDQTNGQLEIIFDDIHEGHSDKQLAALKDHLAFILEQLECVTNDIVETFDEQCRTVTTDELCESFYANRRSPIAAGFLQWNRSCDFLIRIVNSNTWTGSGTSPYAISKVLLHDRVVGISKLEHLSNYKCTESPSTVLKIDESAWNVAAANGVVRISNFLDEFGQPISAQSLADQCHITEGTKLPNITPEQAKQFEMAHTQAMQSEPYWSQRLANYEPYQLSLVQKSAIQSPAWAATTYQTPEKSNAIEILVAWLIYIARDSQITQLQIGLDATECWKQKNEATCILAKSVPFETFINLDDTFQNVMASVEKDYEQLINQLPCLSDTFIRHAPKSLNNLNGKTPWELAVSLIDIQSEDEHSTTDASNFALSAHGNLITLQISKNNGAFRWIYDTNRITEDEINNISLHLITLLASAHSADAANKIVAKLNLLPKAERELLLNTWNPNTINYTPSHCLHQLFESQVKRDEKAIALEYKGETLSYAKLNIQANKLAHYLIARGVKPDDRIALCVERSTTMIVAILGILKAGGAYVPLDPVYTSKRLTNTLKDADPIILLADATGLKALGDHHVPVIDLDKLLAVNLPIDNPATSVTPLHLAYVIYTSGSTGTPKGVMVEHQQVVRLFEITHDKFDFKKEDKWSLFHSFSFDFSVWEIWGALLNGSQLSITPHHITRSMDEFYDWICNRGITVLNQSPSAFKMLMKVTKFKSRSDRLRYVIFGAEALEPLIAKRWFEKYDKNHTILINMYGTTETTVHVTYQRLNILEDVYSVGRPLSDLCVYLLDSYGEPAPLGAEAELYIGGAGVARGYLNRPELTAERFLPDPFSNITGARMYRTGDRARYLPDGNLVYLGRKDHQVKIRGFRIELGEIEAILVKHPQVQEAIVQPYGNGLDTRLVAYVITESNESLVQKLRNYLSPRLPDYMLPVAYVCLSSFPLTPNGKLDRRALPAPDDNSFVRRRYEAPKGEIEEKLADIWREVLNIQCIGRNDNFFELGGHSLLVVQFVNIAKHANIKIDARGVFSFPKLKDLAKQITNRSNRLCYDCAIPVRPNGNGIPLFLLPDAGGQISYAFALSHDIDKNIPVYVISWSSPENKLPVSMEEMANEMISRIKKVKPNGPCALAGYSGGGILAYEMAKQLLNTGYPVSFLGLLDTYPPVINPTSETVTFLTYLLFKYPFLATLNDRTWWILLGERSLEEAIEEMKNTYKKLKDIDFEWEALLSKQHYNYINICAEMKIDSIPIKTYLFRALGEFFEPSGVDPLNCYNKEYMNSYKKLYNFPKLGWENFNISTDFHVITVDGDHLTMMKNPKNRALLGKELTKYLKAEEKMTK